MITQAPRGTRDLFGSEILEWIKLENMIREVCQNFGIQEIRTPIFEHTELFERGVGETTDVVQKEMYTFKDKGDRSITLKPESTAGVVRAYLEQKMYAGVQPTKLFYMAPTFRYEKPQAGRLRQFHQFGVECFGSQEPTMDAEVISLFSNLLDKFEIKNVELNLNSLGGPECRKKYNEVLKNYLKQNEDRLCNTCKERLEKNPLRVLDCKSESCQEVVKDAPVTLDVLDTECRNHFEKLQTLLKEMNIPFVINPRLVRGLDYYTKTVFEFICNDIGAQGTICGGGRYDKLVEEFGGDYTPAVGFGVGMERLLLTVQSQKEKSEDKITRDIFIGTIGENAIIKAQVLAYELRTQGICVETDHLTRSVKAQMKYADKINAKFTMILGDNEIQEQKATLKNMTTGEQIQVNLADLRNDLEKYIY